MSSVEPVSSAEPPVDTPATRRRKVIRRGVVTAYDQADEILERARRDADALRARAQDEARALRRRVVERAYRHCLAAWQARMVALEDERRDLYDELRPQLTELALWIATKIVRRRFDADPALVHELVEEALASLQGMVEDRLLIHVHPAHREAVETLVARLEAANPQWKIVSVLTDEAMSPGGCRLESEIGEVDATLETQLRALRQLLRGEVT
ncbi:MAG: type III secretion system stator protein SctL [Acidobacteriota bacterium]